MSQPVKLSDGLILDARLAAEITARSIAGQVEYWARIGRAMEALLNGRQMTTLCRAGASRPLSQILDEVDSPEGRQRLGDQLRQGPFPQYEPHPDRKGVLVRIEADGSRTLGRFVRRRFQPIRNRTRK